MAITGGCWTLGVCDDYDLAYTPTGHPPFDCYLQSGWVDFLAVREEVECTIPLPFNSGEPLPVSRGGSAFKEELGWYFFEKDQQKTRTFVSG